MTEFNPPYCLESEAIHHPASLFRKAIGSLLAAGGGQVEAGALAVTAHGPPNMSVIVNGGTPPLGEIWVPGSTTPTQGPYFCWNDAPEVKGIGASSEAAPRVDTVIARVHDAEYAGAENEWALEVLPGTPEAGASLENLKGVAEVPASSVVLAYVLVAKSAVAITNEDIKNVVDTLTLSPTLKPPIGPYGAPTGRVAGVLYECDPVRDMEVFLVCAWAQEHDVMQLEVDGHVLPSIDVKGAGYGEALLVIPETSHTFKVPAGKKWKINMLAGNIIAQSSYCPV